MLNLAVINSQAATLTVTNKNNSGTGSLRQAIVSAAPGDTINFAAGMKGSILLINTEFVINKNLTSQGPGANVLRLEMDLGDEQRVIHVTAGTVFISVLALTGGNLAPTSNSQIGGSGLLIDVGASLRLNNCMIRKNQLFYEKQRVAEQRHHTCR